VHILRAPLSFRIERRINVCEGFLSCKAWNCCCVLVTRGLSVERTLLLGKHVHGDRTRTSQKRFFLAPALRPRRVGYGIKVPRAHVRNASTKLGIPLIVAYELAAA
jgi:hypothetical protein